MPVNLEVFRIFIASPSDVEDERGCIDDVINEINRTTGAVHGIHFETVKYETNVFPAVGEYPQDSINKQIANDYDIFMGIMWTRFSTPTVQADSGTQEEFDNAYKRYCSNSNSVEIMFYFKDAPIEPSKIDYTQGAKVEAFKQEIAEKGCLFKTFKNKEEFAKTVRLDLSLFLQQKAKKQKTEKTDILNKIVNESDEDLELGYLDYLEIFDKSVKNLIDFTLEISADLEELGRNISHRAKSINNCKNIDGSVNFKEVKKISKMASQDLNGFALKLEGSLGVFIQSTNASVDSFQGTLNVFDDFEDPAPSEKEEAIVAIESLVCAMTNSRQELSNLCQSVGELPKISQDLNKARRRTTTILADFLAELDKSINLFKNLVEPVRNL